MARSLLYSGLRHPHIIFLTESLQQVVDMPPFRFSLEQVLNYRTQLEQQAKVELARVEQERLREPAMKG